MLHRVTSLASLLLAGACAGRTASSAAPAPAAAAAPAELAGSSKAGCAAQPEMSFGLPVYMACAVDREARYRSGPRIAYEPSPGASCVAADIDIVVNAKGVPLVETAKLVRTNDPSFATAALGVLGRQVYEPARKGGVAVAQLVQVKARMARRGFTVTC